MSHEVKVHKAQISILRELLFHQSAGFAELQKPTGLDSDHFKFHIARLVELGYVEKVRAGLYKLNARGKEYANKLDTELHTIERQPKTGVLLVAVRGEGEGLEVLVQQRLKNPFYGFWCRPTGKVGWGEKIVETAARELGEETGLEAETIEVRGIFHKMDYDRESGDLLEDKIFYAVWMSDLRGELLESFEGGRNAWMKPSDIAWLDKKFEGLEDGHLPYMQPGVQFEEKAFYYTKDEY